MKFKLSLLVFILAVELKIPEQVSSKAFVKFKLHQMHEQLQKGELPITPFMNMVNMVSPGQLSVAAGEGDPSCEKQDSVRLKCFSAWSDYQHGALKYFNGTLCRFNNETAAEVENVLCHFRKSMGINVDLNNLPLSASKTFGSMTVVVDIIVPTEAWAVSAGYQAKGTVTVNGSEYMVVYWGGKEAKSKGFMIEGHVANGLGGNRAGYLTWDLTDEAAQSVKIYHANFPSGSYLSSASKQSTSYRGDAAIYGALSFNKTTSAVSTQIIMIEEQRMQGVPVIGGTAGQFGCFRMYSSGIKNAEVTVAKTKDLLMGTGHAVSSSSLQLDDMDGVTLQDATTTENGTGTQHSNQAALETKFAVNANASVFNISCSSLNNAGGSGASNLFSSSRTSMVDFTKAVADVFP